MSRKINIDFLNKIQEALSFPERWKTILFCLTCTCLIYALSAPGDNGPTVVVLCLGASISMCFIALTLYKIEFGFYGMIVFGFLMASLDRMTHSALPLYTIFYLMPFGLFIIIMIRCIFFHDRFNILWHPITLGFYTIFFYSIFEVFNPEMHSLLGWVSYFRQALSLLIMLFICFYLFRTLKNIRFFFKFLFSAIFITALYGCIQQWFGFSPWDNSWLHSNPRIIGLYSLPGGSIRKFSFLTDPANYGGLMATGAIATLILAIESNEKKLKVLLGFFTLVILLGMSYSGTRTANIMIVAGLTLYIMMTLHQKKSRIVALVGLMLYLFIMYVPIYGNITINRFRTAFRSPTNNASYEVRLMNRERIRPYVNAHPFGGGINTAGVTGQQYNPKHYLAGFPPDSSLVSTMVETGSVGLALQLLFLLLLMAYSVHYYYRCQNKEIKTYYIILTVALFALGLVGGYAQFTLTPVPQVFLYIPFVAITVKLRTLDTPATSFPNSHAPA